MVIAIQDTTGKERSYTLPGDLDEVGYDSFVRFAEHSSEAVNYFIENVRAGTLESNMAVYLYKLSTAISTLIGDDLNAVFRLPAGDRIDHITDMISYCNAVAAGEATDPAELNLDQMNVTLFKVYNYLINVLTTYQPSLDSMQKEYSFEYKGHTYYVPGFLKDAITGQDVAPLEETGRAIEIYQVDKEYHDMVDALEKEIYKEPAKESSRSLKMASLKYNKTIRMLALFVRRKGKDFPLNPERVKSYMDEMAIELQHIPARIGLDIVFFLNHTTALLELIQCTTMLSNHQSRKTLSPTS